MLAERARERNCFGTFCKAAAFLVRSAVKEDEEETNHQQLRTEQASFPELAGEQTRLCIEHSK
jgi:SRSO17 transposase